MKPEEFDLLSETNTSFVNNNSDKKNSNFIHQQQQLHQTKQNDVLSSKPKRFHPYQQQQKNHHHSHQQHYQQNNIYKSYQKQPKTSSFIDKQGLRHSGPYFKHVFNFLNEINDLNLNISVFKK